MKNLSEKEKNKSIIIIAPKKAIKIADLNTHSAWIIFLLPNALAVAPLTAPPNAPLESMLVNI